MTNDNLNIDELNSFFITWNSLSFSKILLFDQKNKKIDFVIDISHIKASNFLAEIITIISKKHPSGTCSFIGNWSNNETLSTQYKKYRLEFLDPKNKYSETDLSEKIKYSLQQICHVLQIFLNEKIKS